ncbi:unnamed protein product [Lepeophtheirus salmonis]|uniref:(salmon louse) hypothetical protein n=1 Tax=Lepeophtheirus salmonis TaxID=72036 RepID=A0A7R8CWN7_LEPSM|nr:unnamed protein product [Lepeophtheirus salmonis]CAF2954830.1 unnamed protein product [Lepeophtheirus salmonis]
MMKASELVCSEKRQAFANISLTRNTIAEMISELLQDLTSQLKQRVGCFIFVSVVPALDRVEVDWSHTVSIATGGAPSMIGKKGSDKVQCESASTQWRRPLLDIPLYFAPRYIVLLSP